MHNTGNKFSSIQQQYSIPQNFNNNTNQQNIINNQKQSSTNLQQQQQINHQTNQLIDDSTQLNSSLSSSSGVGCTSSNSSGLGTSSLFSSSSLCSATTLSNNQNAMNTSSNNGSLINVLLPLADMNSHNLHRAQLISNLNGSNNQYTTLSFNNYSSTSSPSSVNTNATSSTLPSTIPINGQQQLINNNKLTSVYAQNSQTLNDNIYCQTSFNNCAIDNQLPAHYQLLTTTNKPNSNYHLPTTNNLITSNYSTINYQNNGSNYHLLQTMPSVNQSINYQQQPSINNELNKYNSNAQFDLICDNKPIYSKLSPNSNSLIKECLITNANQSKFIELTSSQNSSSTIYSDNLKSKLNNSNQSKDIKLMNSTGLDLLNCDKTYNELLKNEQLKTDTLNKLDKCKDLKLNQLSKNSKQTDQLTTKIDSSKSKNWCCSTDNNSITPSSNKKQGLTFIICATFILFILICFFLSLTTQTVRNLLVESGVLPESIRLRFYNETTNKNQFQPDSPSSYFTPIRPFLNETIYPLNPRPSLDYSDSLIQHQQQGSNDNPYNQNNFHSPFSAHTNSQNHLPYNVISDNNIPQIGPGKDDLTNDLFGSQLNKYEDRNMPKNVTAQAGHMVYLHCIVEAIGDKMVSWIRLKDFYLLTVGTFIYTSDSRFSVRQVSNNDWTLQILRLTTHDQGQYECQLNSDPPRSQFYNLIVLVPYAEIYNEKNNQEDTEINPGSEIKLICIIRKSPIPPSFIFWYHEQRMINFDLNNAKARGKINIYKKHERSDTVVSELIIFNAISADSGNYTCAPSNSAPTSIYVQVLQGEKRLPEETINGSPLASSAQINMPNLIIYLCLIKLLIKFFN